MALNFQTPRGKGKGRGKSTNTDTDPNPPQKAPPPQEQELTDDDDDDEEAHNQLSLGIQLSRAAAGRGAVQEPRSGASFRSPVSISSEDTVSFTSCTLLFVNINYPKWSLSYPD